MRKEKRRRKNNNTLFEGVVDHVNKRYCFIESEKLKNDIKVYSKNMNGAIHRDHVLFIISKSLIVFRLNYQRITTDPQVNPLPKAANTTRSPLLIFPFSQASVKAIITEAAVVLPYFMILL